MLIYRGKYIQYYIIIGFINGWGGNSDNKYNKRFI